METKWFVTVRPDHRGRINLGTARHKDLNCRALHEIAAIYEISGGILEAIPECRWCGARTVQKLNVLSFLRWAHLSVVRHGDGSGALMLTNAQLGMLDTAYRIMVDREADREADKEADYDKGRTRRENEGS